MKNISRLISTLLLILTLSGAVLADSEEDKVPYDLSGTWKVYLSNSLSRKLITFYIDQKDGRPRGEMSGKGMQAQRMNGRFGDDNEIFFWATHRDRGGLTTELEFKGHIEGEPGDLKMVGECEYFEKYYDWEATRAD